MRLKDLVDGLENLHPESEIRIVMQPDSPVAYKLRGVVAQSELETGYTASRAEDIVFLVVGRQAVCGSERLTQVGKAVPVSVLRKVFDYC